MHSPREVKTRSTALSSSQYEVAVVAETHLIQVKMTQAMQETSELSLEAPESDQHSMVRAKVCWRWYVIGCIPNRPVLHCSNPLSRGRVLRGTGRGFLMLTVYSVHPSTINSEVIKSSLEYCVFPRGTDASV